MIEISFKIILWQMCSIFLLKIQKLFANLRKLLKLKNAFFFLVSEADLGYLCTR